MKPEPMRTTGKRRIEMTTAEWMGRLLMPFDEIPSNLREGKGEILKLRQEKEIISAVEWLKDQLFVLTDNQENMATKFNTVCETINKAFQDVIKK